MRALPSLALLGLLTLGACDVSQEITAPGELEPQFHVVTPGTPDGDYSMYYFDLNLRHDLLIKIAQRFPAGSSETMCPGNTESTSHNTLGDEPPFPEGWAMPQAGGYGTFVKRDSWRRTRGTLWVTGACWFDEWNPQGFPESAWVAGWALVGWRFRPFTLMLESRGFPAEGHLRVLDRAVLDIPGVLTLDLLGEIHHESGTTLIQ